MGTAAALENLSVKDQFKAYEKFCKCLIDAWAVVDQHGKVVKSNLMFAQLVGESSKKVLKADSFDSLLKMEIQGKDVGIAEILSHQTPTRIDEVTAHTEKRSDLTLILGVYPFIENDIHAGSFLLIRDVTDDKALHDKYKTTKTDSITDQLTGLNTRRYFEAYLATQERNAASASEKTVISVIMVDIDHFKQVNDVHGHQAGDAILKRVGEIVGKSFRKTDVTCRYGGEEFIILLPETPGKGACKAAESLRKTIEAEKIVFQGKHIPITISLGISEFDLGQEATDATIERADKALYESKEKGRNQSRFHDGNSIISVGDI